MTPHSPTFIGLLAACLLATASSPAPAQQRLRERIQQRMQPQSENTGP